MKLRLGLDQPFSLAASRYFLPLLGVAVSDLIPIGIASSAMTDGAIDPGKMEDSLTSHLGDFFESISAKNAAITAKVFGGKPQQKVDLCTCEHLSSKRDTVGKHS